MSLESELRTWLLADAGIQAELASSTGIYPEFLPQEPELPALTYQRVSTERNQTLDGVDSLVGVRIQFDAWARTMDDAVDLADALRARLDGLVKTTLSTLFVDSAFLESDQDLSSLEGDRRHRRRSLDFTVRYVEV